MLKTTEDVLITNCTMADSIFACIGIGSETSGGIRNVRIEHCKFTHARTHALYIKSRPGRGAFIEDVTANDLEASNLDGGFLRFNILNSGIQDQVPVPGDEGIPTIRNFRFTNIRVSDCSNWSTAQASTRTNRSTASCSKTSPAPASPGIALANIKNAEISGIEVSGIEGPLLGINNVTGSGLEGAAAIPAPKVPPDIPTPEKPYQLR